MALIKNMLILCCFVVGLLTVSRVNSYPFPEDLISGAIGGFAQSDCDSCSLLEDVFSRVCRSSSDNVDGNNNNNNNRTEENIHPAAAKETVASATENGNLAVGSDLWSCLPEVVQSQLYGMYYSGVQTLPLSNSMVIDLTDPNAKMVLGYNKSIQTKTINLNNGTVCNNATAAGNDTASEICSAADWKQLMDSVLQEQEKQMASMIQQQIEEERYSQYVHKQREEYLMELQRQQQEQKYAAMETITKDNIAEETVRNSTETDSGSSSSSSTEKLISNDATSSAIEKPDAWHNGTEPTFPAADIVRFVEVKKIYAKDRSG